MRLVFHIFLRDIRSLIVAPTGAIVAALFALTCGLMFVSNVLDIGAVATDFLPRCTLQYDHI